MGKALIVVDVQNDFCEGGSMGVPGGSAVAARISEVLADWAGGGADGAAYDSVVATRDHHIDPGSHWSEDPDFVTSWPVHCKVGTPGEEFHPDLQPRPFEEVFLKGQYSDGYSGFDGQSADDVWLTDWLLEHGIDSVDVCGLATDYCVRATALDAVRHGFDTRVRLDLSAGVAPESTERTLAEFRASGVRTE